MKLLVCEDMSVRPLLDSYHQPFQRIFVRSGTVQLRKFEYCQCILVVWWTNMTSSSFALQSYHVKKTLSFRSLNLIDELYIY